MSFVSFCVLEMKILIMKIVAKRKWKSVPDLDSLPWYVLTWLKGKKNWWPNSTILICIIYVFVYFWYNLLLKEKLEIYNFASSLPVLIKDRFLLMCLLASLGKCTTHIRVHTGQGKVKKFFYILFSIRMSVIINAKIFNRSSNLKILLNFCKLYNSGIKIKNQKFIFFFYIYVSRLKL